MLRSGLTSWSNIRRLDQVMELVSSTTTSWALADRLDLAAVVSQVKQCLQVAGPALELAGSMSAHRAETKLTRRSSGTF